MSFLDSIFGTPNRDAAEAQAANQMFQHFSQGNQLHNDGTTGRKLKDLAVIDATIRGGQLDDEKRKATQNKLLIGEAARRKLAITKTAEGGKSNRAGMNATKGYLSSLAQAQAAEQYSYGEYASNRMQGIMRAYTAQVARGNEKIGVGVAGKPEIAYKKDNNLLKAGKLALQIGSMAASAGAFGTIASGAAKGQSAGFFDAIFNRHNIEQGSGLGFGMAPVS